MQQFSEQYSTASDSQSSTQRAHLAPKMSFHCTAVGNDNRLTERKVEREPGKHALRHCGGVGGDADICVERRVKVANETMQRRAEGHIPRQSLVPSIVGTAAAPATRSGSCGGGASTVLAVTWIRIDSATAMQTHHQWGSKLSPPHNRARGASSDRGASRIGLRGF